LGQPKSNQSQKLRRVFIFEVKNSEELLTSLMSWLLPVRKAEDQETLKKQRRLVKLGASHWVKRQEDYVVIPRKGRFGRLMYLILKGYRA
jgi:hypothetical protein